MGSGRGVAVPSCRHTLMGSTGAAEGQGAAAHSGGCAQHGAPPVLSLLPGAHTDPNYSTRALCLIALIN